MDKDKFSYQKLRVYEDMIRTISLSEEDVSSWDSVHAIVDHFTRASEGIFVCFAEACRTRRRASKNEAIGYSLGSILECASCFDIAVCKSLCSEEKANNVKQELSAIFRQLYNLRKSWRERDLNEVREDSAEYGKTYVFNHERLKVYGLALQVIRILASRKLIDRLSRTDFRRIDEAATSIVLNIAEGNGRFAHLDHSRFLKIANHSNTKLAARLEVSALRGSISKDEVSEIIGMLVQIDRMTAKLSDVWTNQVN